MKRLNFIKKILFTNIDVDRASCIMAHEIKEYYKHVDKVHVIVVLEGGRKISDFIFSNAWLGCLKKFYVHYVTSKSYSGIERSETVSLLFDQVNYDAWPGAHVLIVDDIYDSGLTLNTVVKTVSAYNPKDVQCAVMIERTCPKVHKVNVKFVGLKTESSDYLVGCGLDFNREYRDLPYVATVKNGEDDYWNPETGEVKEIRLCNQCGKESCPPDALEHSRPDKVPFYGLVDATARGGYHSPILFDCMAYRFDICELCLKEMFDNFILPVDMLEYDPWSGKIRE